MKNKNNQQKVLKIRNIGRALRDKARLSKLRFPENYIILSKTYDFNYPAINKMKQFGCSGYCIASTSFICKQNTIDSTVKIKVVV